MEINELKKQLMNVDINDTNEILKLLALAHYYNDELIEEGFYIDLYNRLKDKYKPITEVPRDSQEWHKIKNVKTTLPVVKYAFYIMERVMPYIKGKEGKPGIDAAASEILCEYHNRVNTDFARVLYKNKIKENLGNKVVAVVKHNQRYSLESGILSYQDGLAIDNKKLGNDVVKIKADNKIIYFLQKSSGKKRKKAS